MYEDLPSTPALSVDSSPAFPPPYEVRSVLQEMRALQAAQLVVDCNEDPQPARDLVRDYLDGFDPATLEERVIEVALRRITATPLTKPSQEAVRSAPWEAHVADTVALSWMAWVANDHETAVSLVKRLRGKQKSRETFSGKTGAIHLLTLSFWSQATLLLIQEDPTGARRFFKRALELGSQFGTESHPMISWAYAASFFGEAGTARQ